MSSRYKVTGKDGKTITFGDLYDDLIDLIDAGKCDSDTDADVIEKLFDGIEDHGFYKPTLIQTRIISPFFQGRDIVAQSQSGTGKTGAFTIGCLSRINPAKKYPQAVVISNTKDLAEQTFQTFKSISNRMGIDICLTIGGDYMSVRENIKCAKKSHVIVGTPGRIENIINKKALDTRKVRILIMDEADALLNEDFEETIESIAKSLLKKNRTLQTCIFSATYTEKTLELAELFLRKNPFKIEVKREELNLKEIEQFIVSLEKEDYKIETLKDLYSRLCISQSIIFVRTRHKANIVYNTMRADGHSIGVLHGSMKCGERMDTMRDFRKCKTRILIATNVLARGIDVQNIGVIINYDVPDDVNVYLHRIGRSGRYGTKGVAINFMVINQEPRGEFLTDEQKMEKIQKYFKIQIEDLPQPEAINNILRGVGNPGSSKEPENKEPCEGNKSDEDENEDEDENKSKKESEDGNSKKSKKKSKKSSGHRRDAFDSNSDSD